MEVLFPSGVYEPPHYCLPFVGAVVVSPGDVRMGHFVLREEAVRFIEEQVGKLLVPGGEPRR
jgi:hypothetical protein